MHFWVALSCRTSTTLRKGPTLAVICLCGLKLLSLPKNYQNEQVEEREEVDRLLTTFTRIPRDYFSLTVLRLRACPLWKRREKSMRDTRNLGLSQQSNI